MVDLRPQISLLELSRVTQPIEGGECRGGPRIRIFENKLASLEIYLSEPISFPGAFVIPFMIMMVLEGMPLLLLELGIGQKLRRGSYVVWNLIDPRLGGIGLGSTVIAVLVGCYYNMIIAWCIYYLIKTCSVSALGVEDGT